MKKAEKIKLAEDCFNTIKELGLEVEVQGDWFALKPPNKIPVKLIQDTFRCDYKTLINLMKKNT